MNKDEYILRSLSKIKHKQWELYIISRILHRLNDPEIEFVCQQHVQREDGTRALTDMFFPQFRLHLEIDEKQHEKKEHKKADIARSRDIINQTGHQMERIKTFEGKADLNLEIINAKVDKFIECLKEKKRKLEENFIPWDFDMRYSPEPHIKRGFIDLEIGATFRTHADVLKCFGCNYISYQRGGWTYNPTNLVWFPKLYKNRDWNNKLSEKGCKITEISIHNPDTHRKKVIVDTKKRIVFAHATDPLGKTLYRFQGVFKINLKETGIRGVIFDRIDTKINLPSPPQE